MIYAIIIIVTAVAIFLIFRNDHDDSYNKSEKGPRKEPKAQSQPKQQTQYQKDAGAGYKADTGASPKTEKKTSAQSLKDLILGEIELDRSTARLIAEIKVIIPSSREYVEEEIRLEHIR